MRERNALPLLLRDHRLIVHPRVQHLPLANLRIVQSTEYPVELRNINTVSLVCVRGGPLAILFLHATHRHEVLDAVFHRINTDFEDSAQFLEGLISQRRQYTFQRERTARKGTRRFFSK